VAASERRAAEEKGFSQDELELIMDMYANADVANQGEMTMFECRRALAELGYTLPLRRFELLMSRVHLNTKRVMEALFAAQARCSAGLLEFRKLHNKGVGAQDSEFVRLFRLIREDEIRAARSLLVTDLLANVGSG